METGIRCIPHSFQRRMATHNLKSGISTRIVQALGDWESIVMVKRHSKLLSFDDALQLCKKANRGEV
jgi:site-specific recombinase XerD